MKQKRIVRMTVMAVALACMGSAALAADATIQQLSGTISVQKADGSVRLLTRQSEVGKGDTLNTEKDSYAQVKFNDGGVVTLKPNTRIKIDDFNFDEKQQEQLIQMINCVINESKALL